MGGYLTNVDPAFLSTAWSYLRSSRDQHGPSTVQSSRSIHLANAAVVYSTSPVLKQELHRINRTSQRLIAVYLPGTSKNSILEAKRRPSRLHNAWLCSPLVPDNTCGQTPVQPRSGWAAKHVRVWARRLSVGPRVRCSSPVAHS